jgi:hypothetical protein
MRLVLACCVLALLSGCGRSAKAPEDSGSPGESAAMVQPAGAAGPCTTEVLPVTGLCGDANPALFGAVDPQAKPYSSDCVWRTEEVSMSDKEALVFRSQDCSATGAPRGSYRFADGVLTSAYPGSQGDEHAMPVLEIFNLGTGQTAQQVALQTLSTAPEDQRAECEIQPDTLAHAAGKAFDLLPNAELTRRLDEENQGDDYDACGKYGLSASQQYWEARPGRALFHMLGEDDPVWDPVSYTFYWKGSDGIWTREG